MEISFPTDTDGFLSQECPSCNQRFKVIFGQGSEEPISFCPYCGYNDQGCWYTQDQVDHIQAMAADTIIAPELRKIEQKFKRTSNGFFELDIKSNLPKPSIAPMETDDPFDILHFPCCKETVKVDKQQKHFCLICGMEVDMTINDLKKIFLSHKGVDKNFVIDFKKTLEELGYDPWLDEDAMPAGTTLERGLLQGMQDSCGVVFFITPSFKDEGYLQTEIDYAIQEKRKKEDKFAIITLQFISDDGKEAPIPDLLEPYVWKKPKTSLEALREIVRALPIAPGIIDWRDEIEGVVKVPQMKSTSTTLSTEAKMLLKEAAAGDGMIFNPKVLGGEIIQANGKSMLPDQDPRTVARWMGGIEDLQRSRYIKDVGVKGEMFEITREGYAAADELDL